MPQRNDRLDAIIIGGDVPDEFLGRDIRAQTRLTIDGYAASLRFLRAYFRHGESAAAAQAALAAEGIPFVALNGPYLTQFLTQRGLRVRCVPLLTPERARCAALLADAPRAVVLSSTFLPFAETIDTMAAAIRQLCPDTCIIAGGIQIWKSYRHRALLESGGITPDIRDAVSRHNYLIDPARLSPLDLLIVSASGEETLARVLTCIRERGDATRLPNVAFQAAGQWQVNRIEPEPPHEVRVDWQAVATPLPHGAFIPVQAGQGCAFCCKFCDFRGLRPVSLRNTASVIAEIRTIPEHDGLRRVYFTDDNLFVNRTRAKTFCRALIESGLRLRWRGMFRVDIVTDEIAALMARSGCLEVLLGIESGDADMLDRMGKHTTPEAILRGVSTLARHGISTKSTFIVGYPGETEKSIANTVNLLNAYPRAGSAVHRYLFFRFGVLPLSDVASPKARARYRLRGYGYHWTHATMTSDEAVAHMAALHPRIRPDLSPSYTLEVPELDGLTVNAMRQIFVARNLLALAAAGVDGTGDPARHWQSLREAFG